MKKLLILAMTLGSASAFADNSKFEFLPKDCSMSREEASYLTQNVMNERTAIAEKFKDENLTQEQIKTMTPDQLFKTHTQYNNLKYRSKQAAQEFAEYIVVECRHLPAWK